MRDEPWVVIVSHAAREDIREVRRWSLRVFGERQAKLYTAALKATIKTLTAGTKTIGLRSRPDLPSDVLSLRAPPARSRGRHLLIVRLSETGARSRVEILRILHDKMDLPRHVGRRP